MRALPTVTRLCVALAGALWTALADAASANASTLEIGGYVRNTFGAPIVGALVKLRGPTEATARSNLLGGFTFRVRRGSYTLTASDACAPSPAVTQFENLASNRQAELVLTGGDCFTSIQSNVRATGSLLAIHRGPTVVALTFAHLVRCSTDAAVRTRLQQMERLAPIPLHPLTIGARAALEGHGVPPAPAPPMMPGGKTYGWQPPQPPPTLNSFTLKRDHRNLATCPAMISG